MHGFVEEIGNIVSFISNTYSFLDYRIALVNNSDSQRDLIQLKEFESDNIKVIQSKTISNLQAALWEGYNKSLFFNENTGKYWLPQVIQIIESDAIPNRMTFLKMIEAFFSYKEKGIKIGSITPMYTWKGSYCYPTHKHWFTDPLYERNKKWGTVRDVGKPGVPFLFSLWEPLAFLHINNPSFKKIVHLDRDFGGFLHERGYKHLRLCDISIEHLNGGKNSRR